MHEFSLIPPPQQQKSPAENFFPEWAPHPSLEKRVKSKDSGTSSPK